MALKAKLDLLSLSDEERAKASGKFLATLALVSEEELNEVLTYLSSQGVQITNAREIKVLADTKAVMAKKFSILGEIHEEGIYREDPTLISRNAIDIYKKIQYCKQNGIAYKREDGIYEPFLFSEAAWQKTFNRESTVVSDVAKTTAGDSIITIEPVVTSVLEVVEPVIPVAVEPESEDHIDIKEYMMSSDDEAELEARTTNFAAIRKELEGQLAELDALKNMSFDDSEISFTDLEPETYGMGRAA